MITLIEKIVLRRPCNVGLGKGSHYFDLFVLAVEVLANAVRQNKSIRGVDGQETELLQYSVRRYNSDPC